MEFAFYFLLNSMGKTSQTVLLTSAAHSPRTTCYLDRDLLFNFLFIVLIHCSLLLSENSYKGERKEGSENYDRL